MRGEIGESAKRGHTKQEISKIDAETAVLETKRKSEKATADAELTNRQTELDMGIQLSQIKARRAAESRDAELQRDVERKTGRDGARASPCQRSCQVKDRKGDCRTDSGRQLLLTAEDRRLKSLCRASRSKFYRLITALTGQARAGGRYDFERTVLRILRLMTEYLEQGCLILTTFHVST